MALDPAVKEAVEHVLRSTSEPLKARLELQEIGDDQIATELIRPFVLGFGYTLHIKEGSARDENGDAFGPTFTATDEAGNLHVFPPDLAEVQEVDLDAWEDAISEIDHPLVQARMGDLLWERRRSDRPDHFARSAIKGLAELSRDPELHPVQKAQNLSRALELAMQIRDRDSVEEVRERMIGFVQADLENHGDGPGAALTVLRPLIDLDPDERPDQTGTLLEDVDKKYGADPYIAETVSQLLADLTDPEERESLRRKEVHRWREEAGMGDSLLRIHRLEHALELAIKYGLSDEADEIRVELGRTRPEDLDLQTITTDIEISKEESDAFLAQFNGAQDWQQALVRLGAQPPPHGSRDKLNELVDELMQVAPIQFLITKTVMGPDNASTIYRATDQESHRYLALAEQQALGERIWAVYAAKALFEIKEKFGVPDRAELTSFFQSDLVTEETAERFARSVEIFWGGEFDESGHTIVPRIERVYRDLARTIGVNVVREPRGTTPGGVVTFGSLMAKLEPVFEENSWFAFHRSVLVNPLGLNLRNLICHGLVDRVGPNEVALLIQIAIQLRGLRLKVTALTEELSPSDGPPDGAQSADGEQVSS